MIVFQALKFLAQPLPAAQSSPQENGEKINDFPTNIETIINEIKSSTIGDSKKMATAKKKQYKKKEVKAKKKKK